MSFSIRPYRCFPFQFTVLVFALGMIAAPSGYAAKDGRPFWTEKSAFMEGEDLYVVGVASNVKTAEEGRRQAFEQGKIELMNYAQVTSLEAQGLVIETQMTFEEDNRDGTVTVFRLLRVPVNKLVAVQGRIQARTTAQEQVLDQSRRDLEKRAQALEQQQRHVQQLLQQLLAKFPEKKNEPIALSNTQVPPTDSLEASIRSIERRLESEEHKVIEIAKRARDRIKTEEETAHVRCKYLVEGMRKNEVVGIMGNNLRSGGEGLGNYFENVWSYGTSKKLVLEFGEDNQLHRVSNCDDYSWCGSEVTCNSKEKRHK